MDIPHPESSQLVMDDCRRLTGPSLLWDKCGAILDIMVDGLDMDSVLACWYRNIGSVLEQLDCASRACSHRRFENGYNLVVEAPIDQLNSAVRMLEVSWYFCACELLQIEARQRAALLHDLRESMQRELDPALTEMQAAAAKHRVDFLVDDDYLCVGHGIGNACWPIAEIPPAGEVDWASIHDIPVALVTGTNGKSTSVRLLDSIARAGGQVSGLTSTDFVRVGDDVLDRGDYSGPGGARMLLRDKRLEVAFLEVARGGILRRGLPLQRARAALVTNVARDHLGQYGVNSLAALAATKLSVAKALGEDGVLVLNADDDCILQSMQDVEAGQICWFSLEQNNQRIQQQLLAGGRCCYIEDGEVVYSEKGETHRIGAIRDIPMTLDGAAQHNLRNVLGAVGVATAMAYDFDQIMRGLQNFRSDQHDNPGRLNLFELTNGARVIVDYAHNAHGIAAVVGTLARIPAKRLWALSSSAGDRSDEEIGAIAAGLASLQPHAVVIVELEHYLRGREPGEVSKLLAHAYQDNGLHARQLFFSASPLAGVERILEQMQADDLALLLVLDEREEVFKTLQRHCA